MIAGNQAQGCGHKREGVGMQTELRKAEETCLIALFSGHNALETLISQDDLYCRSLEPEATLGPSQGAVQGQVCLTAVAGCRLQLQVCDDMEHAGSTGRQELCSVGTQLRGSTRETLREGAKESHMNRVFRQSESAVRVLHCAPCGRRRQQRQRQHNRKLGQHACQWHSM